jgi:peptidoglycan hydrolase-like protein with peptidoglycan-binding domain
MAWRLARSLEKLRAQVNGKWPNRSKSSDGSIGDEGHSARTSDHNPDDAGVVRAIDITHDPRGGFDSYAFADMLLKEQDPRLKYVISNRRIGSGPAGPQPGAWRKYTGTNPHDHHCHISVVPSAAGDDTKQWDIDGNLAPTAGAVAAYVPPPATLRSGSSGEDVRKLQAALHIFIDGQFGPLTENALKNHQVAHGLIADGICGPQTWKTLT